MKMEVETRQRIVRNVFLSLFIYILPIVLMFLTFYVSGQRPWEKKQHEKENFKSVNKKNTLNNGNSD
jgi:preprotein translocase subunit YajC